MYIEIYSKDIFIQKDIKNMIETNINMHSAHGKIDSFFSEESLLSSISQANILVLIIDADTSQNWRELANRFKSEFKKTYIIIVSSKLRDAIEGYRLGVFRFILKDEEINFRFDEAIISCIREVDSNIKFYEIRFVEGNIKFRLNNLKYIESEKHKVIFHFENYNKVFTQYNKLSVIQSKLNEKMFIRVHQSYLVNRGYIKTYKRYELFLKSGEKIPISKCRYKAFSEKIKNKN